MSHCAGQPAQAGGIENLDLLAAEADEALLEIFFAEGTLTQEQLESGLRNAVFAAKIFPLVCTSSTQVVGIQPLLDAIVKYVPSPAQRPFHAQTAEGADTEIAASDSAPYAAFVWKTIADPFAGRITMFRVISGNMTYMEQRRRYRSAYDAATEDELQKRFDALSPAEQEQLLRELGAEPRWHLPSRFEEGYGVHLQTLERLAAEGTDLVVTVDCGITAVDEIARAAIQLAHERIGALIATSLMVKGWLSENEWYAGISGTYGARNSLKLFEEADCVIAVGASKTETMTIEEAKRLYAQLDQLFGK